MARGGFSRRRSPVSGRLIAILAGVAVVLLVGAVFWFAGQADSKKPPQEEISVPATNIGPDAPAPGGSNNAAPQ